MRIVVQCTTVHFFSHPGAAAMPTASRQTVRTSVLLSAGQYVRLNEIAVKGDVSIAWVIRKAVQQFLDGLEHEQIPLPMALNRGVDSDA